MKTRQELKLQAKEAMRAQRGTAILLLLVYCLVAAALGVVDFWLPFTNTVARTWANASGAGFEVYFSWVFSIGMLLSSVMVINMYGEFVRIYRRETASVGALFTGYGVNFLRKLGGMLWMGLWLFLWSLLFIIPGIIKGFSYAMTPFILADKPDVTAREALRMSRRMMAGNKGRLFVLVLSFFGWAILSAFTLGILAIVFVGPYYYTTLAGFYEEVRD